MMGFSSDEVSLTQRSHNGAAAGRKRRGNTGGTGCAMGELKIDEC